MGSESEQELKEGCRQQGRDLSVTYVIGIFEILEVGSSRKWVSGHGDGRSGSPEK